MLLCKNYSASALVETLVDLLQDFTNLIFFFFFFSLKLLAGVVNYILKVSQQVMLSWISFPSLFFAIFILVL